MRYLNHTPAPQGQPHKRFPSRLILALFFFLPLVGWGQISFPGELTTASDITSGTQHYYLIQSIDRSTFYAIPHTNDESSKVSTTSIPNANMRWCFVDAGIESNIQYYYIVNSTGRCLYRNDGNNDGIRIKKTFAELSSLSDAELTKYKFYLTQTGSDYFIQPKGFPGQYLNKRGGQVNYADGYYIKSSTYNDSPSVWNFVAVGSVAWPQPFTVSTNAEKHYYKFQNVTNTSFYLSNSGEWATVSSAGSDEDIWYFLEAGVDATYSSCHYYYIVNASTEKYLYYTGGTGNDVAKVMDYNSLEADKYRFLIVDGAYKPDNNNYSTCYSIVPKQRQASFSGKDSFAPIAMSDDSHLLLKSDRGTTYNSHWNIEETVYVVVEAPAITNNYDGTITLSTATDGATIYYTTNGDTPDNTSTAYSSPFSLGDATVIKAIAYLGSDFSDVTTYNVPQYTEPTISFNSATSLVTIDPGSGGTAYYNTGDGSQADPTTSSTVYSAPFTVSSATTVKAIATHAGYLTSDVASLSITQVATPTIQNNGSNAISITTATDGATIYYTTDGSTPTTSSTEYTEPLTENVSGVTIKAIAVKVNMITSAVGSGSVTLQCAAPVITRNGNSGFIATCAFPATGVTIYYTTDGSTTPTTSTPTHIYSGESVAIALPVTVKAIAVATNYNNSAVTTTTISQGMGGSGTEADPYTIEYQSDVADFITKANDPDLADKYYKVISTDPLDFSGAAAITQPFSGNFDGNLQTLTGLGHALFNTVNGGVVKNVMLKNVTISQSGYVGAICGTADGAARIYNCGILPTTADASSTSSIGSTDNYCGGLVGFLDGSARVINCFSYANITSGAVKAGIVGYNNVATVYTNIQTMVMNCMFYGNITEGGTIAPIYGGTAISNDYYANTDNRLNNYNYYLYEAPFSKNNTTSHVIITDYNCALAAERRFLVRFEFYRHLLNSTRELAAWYATDSPTQSSMLKWVIDKSVAPYPILKEQGKYPSKVNYDPTFTYIDGVKHQRDTVTVRNHGGQLGTLTVNISKPATPTAGQDWPSDVTVQSSVSVPILDKDTANYNFNYRKIQLPYYNDVGNKNYTNNKVVTGWMITSMSGGTQGSYTETNYDSPNYNYADRSSYAKDLYSISHRIFSQGGYFNVPEGVTAITIEPYWGKAAYLSDACYDRYGYNTTDDLTQVGGGQRYVGGTSTITVDGSSQTVYTTAATALAALTDVGSPTVYDYAVVLVGNYHHHATEGKEGPEISSGTKPFTIMSIDLNEDNEPDYCLIYRSGKNKQMAPIRFDFITVPGMVMAHKMATHGDLGIPGNCTPRGWFEITTTGLIKYGQFEHSYNGKALAPVIFMGGVIDQFVANNTGTTAAYNSQTKYMLFGDNVWFQMLSNGGHMDKTQPTPHRPISLIGGEYEKLYLSGYFRPDATTCTAGSGDNNAECYIDGGKFGEVAGAGQENISGNITWLIDHADMESFYGGGLKIIISGSQITGNISTTIKNSHVNLFCGGPKFGDMAADQTVTTTAVDCVFGTYFGAGFGGTSTYRECLKAYNQFEYKNYDFNAWVDETYDKSSGNGYRGKFSSGKGVACGYEYELFGGSAGNVGRLYHKFASFSLAQTNDVFSTLTGCIVTENFYGGGNLGKVNGNVNSTLNNCTVEGSVFGAGFSATVPSASIMATGGFTLNGEATNPYYNETTGVYEKADYPATTDYKWTHVESIANYSQTLSDDGYTIKTTEDLTSLGVVTGGATLTLKGNSEVIGNVFGGGDASAVNGNTTVKLQGNTTVRGSVYGGGNNGSVGGNSEVIIQDD